MNSDLSRDARGTPRIRALLTVDAICIAVILILAIIGIGVPRFHSDSWSLFELSKTFFVDFYRTTTFRQFETSSLYSTAFPPLYPFLLALVCPIGNGIYAGIWLNAAICIGILAAMHRLADAVDLPRWAGNFTFVVLLATPGFFDDFVAARTMPLAILLFVLLVDTFVRAMTFGFKDWSVVFTGMISGASVLTRFDFLLPSIAVGVMLLYFCEPSRRLRIGLGYLLGLLPLLAPWVAYSFVVHGQFWASDNMRTVMSVLPTHVLNFEPDSSAVHTLRNAPNEWVYSLLFIKAPPVAIAIAKSALGNWPLVLSGIALFVVVLRRGTKASIEAIPRPLLVLLIPIAIQMSTIVLTGYTVPRYFTALTILIALLVLTAGVATMIEKAAPRVVVIAVAVLAASVPVRYGGLDLIGPRATVEFKQRAEFISTAQYASLLKALQDTPKPRVLVMHNASELGRFSDPAPPPFLDPYRFGALTGIETFPQPKNYSDSIIESFVRKFRITHIYDPKGVARPALEQSYHIASTEHPWLFRLEQ